MQIEWTDKATKEMRKIDPQHRRRILAKVLQFAADPASLANMTTQLVGSEISRLRVGDWRVLYKIEGGDTVVVLKVANRREAYD
jgi:mRNA interferase RelE/StbE